MPSLLVTDSCYLEYRCQFQDRPQFQDGTTNENVPRNLLSNESLGRLYIAGVALTVFTERMYALLLVRLTLNVSQFNQ